MASLATHQSTNLPSSVEDSYRKKCKDLKKRINDIESSNELLASRIQRARRAIQRMRLERAFLLQQLEARTDDRVSDSEGSPSPPPTPVSKPRQKRPRNTLNPNDSPFRRPRSQSPTIGTPDMRDPIRFIDMSTPGANTTTAVSRVSNRDGKRSRGTAAAVGPKKPANAYMYFCELERQNIIDRDGDKEGFEMPKALAQAWRDLKPEGQKYYLDQYEEQKANYGKTGGRSGVGVVAPATGTPVLGSTQMIRGGSVGSSVAAPLVSGYEDGFDGGAVSPSMQDESVFDDADGNGD